MNTREEAIWWIAALIDYELLSADIQTILKNGIRYKKKETLKKSGKIRTCYSPSKKLKEAQRIILRKLLYRIPVSQDLYGFVPGVQMKSGAERHIQEGSSGFQRGVFVENKRSLPPWFLRIDLENFFPSIKKDIVQRMLEDILAKIAYERDFTKPEVYFEFCEILTRLVTYEGGLVQGAPTSPYLANLVISWSGVLDSFRELCINKTFPLLSRLHSTYADDFSVSSKNKPSVRKAVRCLEQGKVVRVNKDKTHLNHLRHGSHRITGISFSFKFDLFGETFDARTTLPQSKQNFYRGRIHKANELLKKGYIPNKDDDGFSLEVIRGYIGWIRHICAEHIPSRLRKEIILFESLTKGKIP